MKRLVIIIAAIFTLMCLAAVDPKNTDVSIKLELDPVYLMDVNTKIVTEDDDTIPNSVGSEGIVLSYDDETFVLESTADNAYYISYIFKEYNPCTLSAKLDGDLIADGYTSSNASDNEKIPFEAVVTVGDTTQTMYSGKQNSVTIETITSGATKIAEKTHASFALKIKPTDESSLKDKKIGSYIAHLILTVTETE